MTKRALEVLQAMAKAEAENNLEDAEIVQEGGQCWVGLERISPRTVERLLQLCLLRHEGSGGCDRYTLNEEGRRMAADPNYVPLIDAKLRELAYALRS